METQVEYKVCGNCQEKINASNFLIHEAYCYRCLKKCTKCKDMIQKTKWDEHFTACEDCGERLPICGDYEHKSSCPMRMLGCRFCGLELRATALPVHEESCGCRTEFCQRCQQFIMVREFEHHRCETNLRGTSFHGDNETADDLEIAIRLQQVELDRANESNLVNVNGSSCRNKCRPTDVSDGKGALIPCEFCHGLYKEEQIVVHQANCYASLSPPSSARQLRVRSPVRLIAPTTPPKPITSPGSNQQRINNGHSSIWKPISPKECQIQTDPLRDPETIALKPLEAISSTSESGRTTATTRQKSEPSKKKERQRQRPVGYELPPLRDPTVQRYKNSTEILSNPSVSRAIPRGRPSRSTPQRRKPAVIHGISDITSSGGYPQATRNNDSSTLVVTKRRPSNPTQQKRSVAGPQPSTHHFPGSGHRLGE
ncbi:unnamed protein product [Calicophoron daubneyi]|uniref:TRAFD1/XAF1 zinc finger domain-containing protein n=1 Tax=Calicophoron daubneyi TaxID=300641 RepID=A0AAV2TK96_CALDB